MRTGMALKCSTGPCFSSNCRMDRLSANVAGGGETTMAIERAALSWMRTCRAELYMMQLLDAIQSRRSGRIKSLCEQLQQKECGCMAGVKLGLVGPSRAPTPLYVVRSTYLHLQRGPSTREPLTFPKHTALRLAQTSPSTYFQRAH